MNKILHSTKFLELKSAQNPKNTGEWFYVHRPNTKNIVVIIPVIKYRDKEDEILFLKTRRPPIYSEKIGEFCIELPAGLVGDERKGETIYEALASELLEETGFSSNEFEILGNNISSSGGLTDEVCTIAKCTISADSPKKEPVDDGGVIVDRIKVPISKVKSWLLEMNKKGYVISAQTLGALYLYYML